MKHGAYVIHLNTSTPDSLRSKDQVRPGPWDSWRHTGPAKCLLPGASPEPELECGSRAEWPGDTRRDPSLEVLGSPGLPSHPRTREDKCSGHRVLSKDQDKGASLEHRGWGEGSAGRDLDGGSPGGRVRTLGAPEHQ